MNGNPLLISDAHEAIVKDNIPSGEMDSEMSTAIMILLHTHRIELRPGSVIDEKGEGVSVIYPLTQRGCAEVVASLWRSREVGPYSGYEYWYRFFNEQIKVEVAEDMSVEQKVLVGKLLERLRVDKRIKALVPE